MIVGRRTINTDAVAHAVTDKRITVLGNNTYAVELSILVLSCKIEEIV